MTCLMKSIQSRNRFPVVLRLDFMNEVERSIDGGIALLLRYKGIGIGDQLTDNIQDPDDYRYHDIFHIAYAVFLGWSPVLRKVLRCKRKSVPAVDHNEDGARAGILEEAVSAIVFSRAKQMKYLEGVEQVDYGLLKSIQEFIQGYEVDQVPLWQWEKAILEGYKVFRQLRAEAGGYVSWDIPHRKLSWSPLIDAARA